MKSKMTQIGLLMLSVMTISGCDRTESDWNKAKQSNTSAAFMDFIAKHPQGPHLDDAKRSLDGLPLKLSVSSIAVGGRFQAYVGGGANISPPEPFGGGGGGIPLISISNGSSFLAGEVSSKDERTNLIRIECSMENPTQESESFKIGDLSLTVDGAPTGDFVAVGYDDRLCAMSDTDRQTVKLQTIELSPKARRTLSYVFTLTNSGSKQGVLMLPSATPASFQIEANSAK